MPVKLLGELLRPDLHDEIPRHAPMETHFTAFLEGFDYENRARNSRQALRAGELQIVSEPKGTPSAEA